MPTTPSFTPARPGRTAARWRGPLVLAPLVVALHAAVLFLAWQAVDPRPALTQHTARDAFTAVEVQPPGPLTVQARALAQPREVRLPDQAPTAAAADVLVPAGAPVTAPVTATVTAPVLAVAGAPVPAPVTEPPATASAVTASLSATPPSTEAGAAPAARSRVAPGAEPVEAAAPGLAASQRPQATAEQATAAALPPSGVAMAPPASSIPGALTAPASQVTVTPPAAPVAPSTAGAPAASGLQATPLANGSAGAGSPPAPEATAQALLPPLPADTLPPALAQPARAAPAAAAPSASPPSLPVYRGEPPPPATLHFTLRRAAVTGRGQLTWKPGAQGYELTLQGTVLGLRALEQTSRGRFDQGSLAPDRFLDARRGRAARAANFRRDVGLISYSAVEQTHPLVRGAQDRLSWMLQLPAVMQANPALRQVGTELHMFVTGARGDGAVWGFRVMSVDRINVPAGEVPRALHLQRLPRHEHDTQADIWLDPSQHHLPARVRLQSGDDVLDLVLERLEKS